MAKKILIVDDDPVQRRLLDNAVSRSGHECITAESGEQALERLASAGDDIALMILDLVMPGLDGMGVLEKVRPDRPQLPIIVQTAHGGIDTVVSAMRAGADDFVVKPASLERLQVSIKNALKLTALESALTKAQKQRSGLLTFDDLIGGSAAMQQVFHIGKRAAASNIPILLEGESGSGKEMIARAIQGASDRHGKPFVTVNCGAIPENLVESILFGHEKGAFTGATEKHTGKFVEANGGTLFLDEVSELPLDAQVKLLRAIQEGEVDPVGSRKSIKVDIRIISATNRDLIAHVKAGKFREDLYYRLNVFPIMVPPLRKRVEDIPALVELFVTRFAAEEGRKIESTDADVVEMLQKYDWPGNVRQLENAVFRAVVLSETNRLTVAEFPQIAAQVQGSVPPPPPVQTPCAPAESYYQGPAMVDGKTPLPDINTPHGGQQVLTSGINTLTETGELRKLEDIEADMIRLAIDHCHGHMSKVARGLGIGRSTLYRKVKEMGLEAEA